MVDVLIGNEEDLQLGLAIPGPDASARPPLADTQAFQQVIRRVIAEYPNIKLVATSLRHVHSASRHSWKAVMWYDGQLHGLKQLSWMSTIGSEAGTDCGGPHLRVADRQGARRGAQAGMGAWRPPHHVSWRYHDGQTGTGGGPGHRQRSAGCEMTR